MTLWLVVVLFYGGGSATLRAYHLDATVSFDGKTQLPIVIAESAGHIGELIRTAAAQGHAVFPLGGRTMLDLGQIPDRPGIGIDLRQLNQVIDYPARDMTITVQAGITIDQLQAVLLKEKQYLPIDVPFPDRATLGGAIATNVSGPRRFGCGTLRDYIIGISVVNDAGQEVKAGGRVVKNVAGYDLMKLYTGSLGTLGITARVTLKVKPLPEASGWHVLPVLLKDVGEVVEVLHRTRTRPVAMELFNLGRRAPVGGPQHRPKRSSLLALSTTLRLWSGRASNCDRNSQQRFGTD